MTLEQFRASLSQKNPHAGLSFALAGLWWDAKGDWKQSHEVAGQDEGPDGLPGQREQASRDPEHEESDAEHDPRHRDREEKGRVDPNGMDVEQGQGRKRNVNDEAVESGVRIRGEPTAAPQQHPDEKACDQQDKVVHGLWPPGADGSRLAPCRVPGVSVS